MKITKRTNQLDIGKEYEIKGYPKDFSETVRGIYIGEAKRELYFALNKGGKRMYVIVNASFVENVKEVVSTNPISSFATHLFALDDIEDKTVKSKLIEILKDLGENL